MKIEWWEGPLWGFDLETTSPDPDEARVVTASLILTRADGSVADGLKWLVDPGVEIPEGATAVHGITNEMVKAEGVPAADALPDLLQRLEAAFRTAPVVVMNAQYDFTVMDREARRHGLPALDPKPIADPYVLDKRLDRYRRGGRKLEDLARLYGAKLDDAHDATADALAAVSVMRAIARIAPLPDPMDLHHRQVFWKRQQQESLEDYFRRSGKLTSPVAKEWPVVPFGAKDEDHRDDDHDERGAR